jgi:thymidine phosphorylase
MSKKLAEGIDGLVLDVKTGSGAFMQKFSDAKALAQSLINTAKAFDKKVIAFITDMNQPLGNYIGNWFEVLESIKILRGEIVPDLCEVSFTLSGAMIFLGGKAKSIKEGVQLSKELIANGKAFDKFVELVKLQGGDISYLYEPEKYPKSKHTLKVISNVEGFVSSIDTYQIGVAALELGAGRLKKEDVIDPKAGIIFHKKLGDRLAKDEIIAELFTDKKIVLNETEKRILNALRVTDDKPKKQKLIKLIMD